MGVKSRSLPSGPWEKLFPRALALIDEISRYGGIKDPFWTLGGGTVLMFRYHHRVSKDIDIFVPDPQYLGFVTPRLSDTAASPSSSWRRRRFFYPIGRHSCPRSGNRMRDYALRSTPSPCWTTRLTSNIVWLWLGRSWTA